MKITRYDVKTRGHIVVDAPVVEETHQTVTVEVKRAPVPGVSGAPGSYRAKFSKKLGHRIGSAGDAYDWRLADVPIPPRRERRKDKPIHLPHPDYIDVTLCGVFALTARIEKDYTDCQRCLASKAKRERKA